MSPILTWPSLLQLDMHLCDHVEHLYTSIRNRALIQYTTPFTSVDLKHMAEAFSTTIEGLEVELAALIMENQIQVLPMESPREHPHLHFPPTPSGPILSICSTFRLQLPCCLSRLAPAKAHALRACSWHRPA